MGQLLVRDIMRIGVTTCKPEDSIEAVAAQMIDGNCTAVVVLDEDGDTSGWINEQLIAKAFLRREAAGEEGLALTAADVMDEDVPEGPADIPLTAAIQLMSDRGVDHLFFLHHAGGRAWPASLLSLRDVVRAVAGPDYIQGQGAGAPRPTPMDLFRQRYPRAKGQS